jgi:hypothetical protein
MIFGPQSMMLLGAAAVVSPALQFRATDIFISVWNSRSVASVTQQHHDVPSFVKTDQITEWHIDGILYQTPTLFILRW